MTSDVRPMKWVSLHTHTTFSYADGFGPVKSHVDRCAELGMSAVAFTEHGNTSSHVQAEKSCKGTSVKPIYGCEIYMIRGDGDLSDERRKYHQILLAENEEGYQNLNRIVSVMNSPEYQFGRFPTVPMDIIFKYAKGLFATSGCADSLLSCTLLGGKNLGEQRLEYSEENYQDARRLIEQYQDAFGDRYFLEVQRFPDLQRTCVLNPAFEQLSRETGAHLVGTADVHYPLPTDNEMQKVLHATRPGTGTVAAAEAGWEYDILLTYPESDQEIYTDLRQTGLSKEAAKNAVLNAGRIASRCNVELPKNEPIKWPYPGSGMRGEEIVREAETRDGSDPRTYDSIEKYTVARLQKGWKFRLESNARMRENKQEYRDRIKYEMERIIPRGFCDYFGMLSYLVSWAKDNKIPVGPARGSAAASLVCYLLRITEVDPLQFPTMMFERFIDPKRLDLPDVDLDFADDRRDEVRQEAIRVFGADRVGNIGNFTRYKGKNSIADIAKVYQIPKFDTQIVKDLIIERSGGDSRQNDTLMDTFEMFPKAAEVLKKYPQLELATRLEGNYRGAGVHAAGLVISNAPIAETCALHTQESGGRLITAVPYDKKDAEYLGMLKADFLGLKTMGEIGIMLDILGMDLEELYQVPLDEPNVMAAFQRNDVQGIFQFEGRATRVTCDRVRPDNFMELADINALARPGPLFSGMTDHYIRVKWGEMEIERLHPIVDEYTSFTKGQIVYQEQVLGIIKDLGGFPVQRVGDIRKIISQKLGEASFNEMYEEFESGANRLHGVEPALAKRIWSFMVTSATYSFCVTGDTVLERAGKGPHCDDLEVTVEELYRQQHDRSNIPMSDKIRSGRLNILGMDDDGRIRPNCLIKIHDPVEYHCSKITTNTGRTVTFSNDHQLLTDDGYKHTMELSVGDSVIVDAGRDARTKEMREAQYKGGKERNYQIDGRTVALKEAQDQAWVRDNGCCSHCGKAGSREGHTLEFAHIMPLEHFGGKFEKYHNINNLMVLCNSCHKKYDYAIQGTRKKRWTRGRPTTIEQIVSIEDAGVQKVYDISMKGPTHNYLGNGFIHHNNIAHCVSYSMLAFWQMWLKIHDPVAFYTAKLRKIENNKQNGHKIKRIMRDSLRHGVKIGAPDLNKSTKDWEYDHYYPASKEQIAPTFDEKKQLSDNGPWLGAVLAGFTQIKGVGDSYANNILNLRDELKNGKVLVDDEGYELEDEDGNLLYETEGNGFGFTEWLDLLGAKGIGPSRLESILDFVEKDDPFELETTGYILDDYREKINRGHGDWAEALEPDMTSDEVPKDYFGYFTWIGMVKKKEFKDLMEDERARSGKSTEEILATIQDPHLVKSCTLHCYDDGDEEIYARISRWDYPDLESLLEEIEPDRDVIIIYGKRKKMFGISVAVKKIQVIDPTDDLEEIMAKAKENRAKALKG